MPMDQNKCFSDILAVKGGIVIAITDLIQAFNKKNYNEIISAFGTLITVVLKVKDKAVSCNFTNLAVSLASLGTNIGIVKFALTVITHISGSIEDIEELSNCVISMNSEKTGVAVGHLFKLLLGYSSN